MRDNVYSKNIRRTIFGSFGRYIAILSIIALGVGFFAGVKNTKDSMMETCNKYVTDHNMYDYRLLSTYGFNEEDEQYLKEVEGVANAEGAITADFFSADTEGNSITLRAHSIPNIINTVNLDKGRMPKSDNECVVDGHFYGRDAIGTYVKVTDDNDKDSREMLKYDKYKIVGIATSPYYLMKTERGTTSLGDGRINAYIYIPMDGFDSEYYTEMMVTCQKQGYIFSAEYDKNVGAVEDELTAAAEALGEIRVAEIKDEAQKKIDNGQAEIDRGRAELKREKDKAYSKLKSAKVILDSKSKELEIGKKQISDKKDDLNKQKSDLSMKLTQLRKVIEQLEAAGDPEGNLAELKVQAEQLEGGIGQIDDGLVQISSQEVILASGERELKNGHREYNKNKSKATAEFTVAEIKLENAERELDEARKKLSEIEGPKLYVKTRADNLGYDSYESNSDIVDSVAKVFPVFFFLIAALVCSTTMSRMIEEERTQIGALRALGYTRGRIMWKYMVYSGSAAMIGCIAGFFAGSKYFPYAIWIAYGMMFGFAPIEFYFNWKLAVISLVVSLICSTGTTYFACRGQLKNTPAEILRPKAPKAGKRILLERIGFIWKHLKFLHKVTARNIFRYKKRMLMMIMGIGGCTALVIAGFGIYDSVAGIADHQYTQVEKYHMAVGFSEELNDDKKDEFVKLYGDDLKSMAVLQQTSVTLEGHGISKSCNMMISGNGNINKAVSFAMGDNKIAFPGRGEAVINNKMAEMLNLDVGDELTVKYDDTETAIIKISGIYRNYVSNYIYISDETYEEYFKKEYEPTLAFLTIEDGRDVYEMSEKIYEYDDVIGISVNEDIRNRVADMMKSLDYIILLVIGCAGALAFIVLFNLGNINITERVREIATIEVLGFYPRETGSYVFRENFMLVILGIVVGLPTGFILHKFIMAQINVDAVAFNEIIEPQSYFYAVLVVMCFNFIVDFIMRRKLKKINMAEALKSIE